MCTEFDEEVFDQMMEDAFEQEKLEEELAPNRIHRGTKE